jgi:hypothetical protein
MRILSFPGVATDRRIAASSPDRIGAWKSALAGRALDGHRPDGIESAGFGKAIQFGLVGGMAQFVNGFELYGAFNEYAANNLFGRTGRVDQRLVDVREQNGAVPEIGPGREGHHPEGVDGGGDHKQAICPAFFYGGCFRH